MNAKPKRKLTDDELVILDLIQRLYGQQNTANDVFISDRDEAVIFVKDTNGTLGLCVVLTNVARWSRDEKLSEDQICEKYLAPQ
jgi:hypothetical protein